MSTYGLRLASFTTAWPHTSPSPKDLAEAGFSHHPTSELKDKVFCQLCNTQLCDWEPADDPMQEHYRCSKSCMRFASESDQTLIFVQDAMALPQKNAQAPTQADLLIASSQKAPQPKPSPKDIGFLDPSLQHDFPDLCLFHDVHVFCNHIERCRSDFDDADILALLPKCLRGEALKWFNQSACQDLALCIGAMRARFPQQALSQAAPQEAPSQPAPQLAPQPIEYHHCKLCNASFSSIARLMRHTQENVCNRPSCRHCDTVFSSKNQLYRHLREECQKQRHRSSPSPSSRSSSRSSPTLPSTCSSLSSTACSSTCSPISSPAPAPAPSPLPRYQAISPSPPSYYLTIADLSTRYARPPCLNVDDLFRMFGGSSATTKSSTIPTSAAPKHPPIRHRGRCRAKKGDESTQAAKHLKPAKTTKTKQQQNQKQKIGFVRTSLQPAPYKSVLPLQRSRSMSCPMAAPGSPSYHMRAPSQISPSPCIDYQCSTSGMPAL